MGCEVVQHPIEICTLGAVELTLSFVLPFVGYQISQNASLRTPIFLSILLLLPRKRIIVETIAIHIVSINFIDILPVPQFEIPAAS